MPACVISSDLIRKKWSERDAKGGSEEAKEGRERDRRR